MKGMVQLLPITTHSRADISTGNLIDARTLSHTISGPIENVNKYIDDNN